MIFAFTVTAPPGLLRAGAEVRAGITRSAVTELERTVSGHFYGMPGREYWRRAGDFAVAFPEQPGTVTVSQPGGGAAPLRRDGAAGCAVARWAGDAGAGDVPSGMEFTEFGRELLLYMEPGMCGVRGQYTGGCLRRVLPDSCQANRMQSS